MTPEKTKQASLDTKISSEISTLESLIAAIYATEGSSDMVSGAFGPNGFTGKIVSPMTPQETSF